MAGPQPLQSQWLGPEPEENLLKTGLVALSHAIGTDGLLDFPRRPNGTPMLTRQGFFERLLSGEASLQNCAAADASAAEADVKRLGLHQLLAIRCANLDFVPTGAGQATKASFLALVDRCTMDLLAQRLLGIESQALTEAHRAVVMRHAVLIYGAGRQLAGELQSSGLDGRNWWLLAVGGTRRYLHLPRCEVSAAAPGVPVCCYRSHTAPNPKDPLHSRIFRWQVLLVEDPTSWTEDPLATEQRHRVRKRLVDAKVSEAPEGASSDLQGAAAEAPSVVGSFLFGDFDVEALFDEFDVDPTAAVPARAAEDPDLKVGDIDDFFDSLLAEPLFQDLGLTETIAATSSAPAAAPTQTKTPLTETASTATSTASLETAATPAVPGPTAGAAKSQDVTPVVASPAKGSAAGSTQQPPNTVLSPPATTATSVTSSSTAPAAASTARTDTASGIPHTISSASAPQPESTKEKVATAHTAVPAGAAEANQTLRRAGYSQPSAPSSQPRRAPEGDGKERSPKKAGGPLGSTSEERLQELLAQFYLERKDSDKLSNVEKIAAKYAGEGVIELWAAIGLKYSLQPLLAVQWLAKTLELRTAVQWPKGQAPLSAQVALDAVQAAGATPDSHASALREALEGADLDALGAIVFRMGCPAAMRPSVWRTLLGWSTKPELGAEEMRERRAAYKELQKQMAASLSSSTDEAQAQTKSKVPWEEVEAEAKQCWRGEAFTQRPEVISAITSVVMTHTWRSSQYSAGSCDIVALMLFALGADQSKGSELEHAEADAFWCLSHLLAEDWLADEGSTAHQAQRLHRALSAYDPALAELLVEHGLGALPALRLGVALMTRAGFGLERCARLWDSMLADPWRFQFCDHLVLALLLMIRGDLLQRGDVGSVAESLLAAPEAADLDTMLSLAYAVCAFERHWEADGGRQFPPQPFEGSAALDAAVAAAQMGFTSIWGKVRAAGAGAWEVGKSAAIGTASQAPAWRQSAVAVVVEAVSTAASAAETAATAASAVLEALDSTIQPADEDDDEATLFEASPLPSQGKQSVVGEAAEPPKLVQMGGEEEPPLLHELPSSPGEHL